MKAILTFFCLALLFAACLSEKSASPGNASTFVRYYSGGYNDEAVAFEETSCILERFPSKSDDR